MHYHNLSAETTSRKFVAIPFAIGRLRVSVAGVDLSARQENDAIHVCGIKNLRGQ